MNKLTVLAVSMLAAIVGCCGYLAYHYKGGDNLYAPNMCHKIQLPVPIPISPDAIRLGDAIVAAANTDANLQINGQRIVSRGNMRDPERHDMAHAMARAEHTQLR